MDNIKTDKNNYDFQRQQLPDGRKMPRRFSLNAFDHRPFEQFARLDKMDWRFWTPLVVIVTSLNIVWWYLPLHYSSHTLQVPFTWQLAPMMGYTLTTSIAIALIITQNFRSYLSYLFIVLGTLFTFTSLIQTRQEIFWLLLLFNALLIIIQQLWLGIQNILGLLLFGALATFTIPIALFYVQNDFITQRFLIYLLPVFFNFFFYFTPIIMPNPNGRKLSILTLALFIVAIFSHHVDFGIIFILLFSCAAFILQFTKAKIGNWQNMLYVLLQMISLIIMYH